MTTKYFPTSKTEKNWKGDRPTKVICSHCGIEFEGKIKQGSKWFMHHLVKVHPEVTIHRSSRSYTRWLDEKSRQKEDSISWI